MGLFNIIADIVTLPIDMASSTIKKVGEEIDDLF